MAEGGAAPGADALKRSRGRPRVKTSRTGEDASSPNPLPSTFDS